MTRFKIDPPDRVTIIMGVSPDWTHITIQVDHTQIVTDFKTLSNGVMIQRFSALSDKVDALINELRDYHITRFPDIENN